MQLEDAFQCNYLQTRQSSDTVGNRGDGKEDSGDCIPQMSTATATATPMPTPTSTLMTMVMTTPMTSTELPIVSNESLNASTICPLTVSTDLQQGRQQKLRQQLSTQVTDSVTAGSSSSICIQSSRLSSNVLFSLPTSPKRSSDHFSFTKAPAISKSQMKGELRLFEDSVFFNYPFSNYFVYAI